MVLLNQGVLMNITKEKQAGVNAPSVENISNKIDPFSYDQSFISFWIKSIKRLNYVVQIEFQNIRYTEIPLIK